MDDFRLAPVDVLSGEDFRRLLDLNNEFEAETSRLTDESLRELVGQACHASCVVPGPSGMLIALDETAHYVNDNFSWFSSRFDRFVYVDRIIIAAAAQGRRLANRLYEELFEEARGSGQVRIVCEINSDPPNPKSDAFHARLGFEPIGEAVLADRGKTVRYLEKRLDV